ncbi:M48 family metallopeptidase [Dokdonella sp.]|uniref:M48 family metallopeptidase n=1 Tax=Dokdonella sp. TaxID=2291710 RepID=UPI0037838C64
MKYSPRFATATIALTAVLAAGSTAAIDLGNALGSATKAAKGMSLSDDDVRAAADQACEWSDAHNKVAPASDKYAKRLAKLTAGLSNEDGIKLSFKAYLVRDVNAFAMANGCVRVMAGLMDIASDDEIRAVIGHEIGHAKLGHTKAKMRTALMSSAAREGVAATGGKAGAIASSELGGLAEAFINAQFSQKEEGEADKYGYEFMVKHKYDPGAMVSMLKKLPAGGGLLSSHPSSPERAKKIEALVAKG